MRQVRSTADDTGFRSPVHSYRRGEPQRGDRGCAAAGGTTAGPFRFV